MTHTDPPSDETADSGDVAARLLEVSDRLDHATTELRRLVERVRTALLKEGPDARKS